MSVDNWNDPGILDHVATRRSKIFPSWCADYVDRAIQRRISNSTFRLQSTLSKQTRSVPVTDYLVVIDHKMVVVLKSEIGDLWSEFSDSTGIKWNTLHYIKSINDVLV